jgi:hypothetical protein
VRKILQRVLVIPRFMNQGNYTHSRIGNVTCGADEISALGDKECAF